MAATALLANAFLIDCVGAESRERASVLVEGERIKEVRLQGTHPTGRYDTVIDCAGMTLMPGLTDAHVHIGAVDVNILDQHREHPSNLVALMMARILEDTLQRGFTTVRDAGGTDWSFKAAVERGIVEGPRLLDQRPSALADWADTGTGAGRPRRNRPRSSAPLQGCARWSATGPTR